MDDNLWQLLLMLGGLVVTFGGIVVGITKAIMAQNNKLLRLVQSQIQEQNARIEEQNARIGRTIEVLTQAVKALDSGQQRESCKIGEVHDKLVSHMAQLTVEQQNLSRLQHESLELLRSIHHELKESR